MYLSDCFYEISTEKNKCSCIQSYCHFHFDLWIVPKDLIFPFLCFCLLQEQWKCDLVLWAEENGLVGKLSWNNRYVLRHVMFEMVSSYLSGKGSCMDMVLGHRRHWMVNTGWIYLQQASVCCRIIARSRELNWEVFFADSIGNKANQRDS